MAFGRAEEGGAQGFQAVGAVLGGQDGEDGAGPRVEAQPDGDLAAHRLVGALSGGDVLEADGDEFRDLDDQGLLAGGQLVQPDVQDAAGEAVEEAAPGLDEAVRDVLGLEFGRPNRARPLVVK